MAHSPSPLAAIEDHFSHLAPTHLTLRGNTVHPWLEDRTYSLYELRGVLMSRGTPYDVRDAVWRHTIRAARLSQDWMVGALGLGMPMLRGTSAQARRRLSKRWTDEIESVIILTAIEQIRVIRLDYARVAYFLRCRVHRAAMGARKRVLSSLTVGMSEQLKTETKSFTDTVGSADLPLFAAVKADVLSAQEADLIARTRLEDVSLVEMAGELGVSYKTLAKRRQRAEERLVTALRAGALQSGETASAAEAQEAGSVIDVGSRRKTEAPPMSNPRLPLAS